MTLLLDTNIIIYFLNKEPWILNWLEKFKNEHLTISIITWMEVLAGCHKHKKTMEEIRSELMVFEIMPFSNNIAWHAAAFLQKHLQAKRKNRIAKFQDVIIGMTALSGNTPLLTNNPKDFCNFKGLKIISP